jgi:hypothetical protein
VHTDVHILDTRWEWDVNKNILNIHKHGISFADTIGVFNDSRALTLDQIVRDELRHITIGMDAFDRVLVVVYTFANGTIRIISARKANRWEKNQYEI